MEVICYQYHGDISNDLDGPLTRFSSHGIFEIEFLKNGNHTESIEWYHF